MTYINERLKKTLSDNSLNEVIKYDNTVLTCSDLEKQIKRYVSFLRGSININTDAQYVLIYLKSPLEGVVAQLACLMYGAIAVPLNKEAPLSYYAIDRMDGVACMITDEDFKLEQFNFPIINICDTQSDSIQKGEDSPCREPEKNHNNYSHCIITSGTTGTPKAVLLRQDAILNQVDAKIKLLKMNSNNRLCVATSLSFVASIWQILATIFVGGTLILLDEEERHNPYLVFKRAEEHNATILCVVPSVLKSFLLTNTGKRKITLDSLSTLVLTGEALYSDIAMRFYEDYATTIINAFGQTETSDDTFHYIVPRDIDSKIYPVVPIGYPIDNIAYKIVDENGSEVLHGEKGELCISGLCLAEGYIWNGGQPDARNSFRLLSGTDSEVLFFTGDLVSQDDGGPVVFHGRVDNQIKISGNRIEPEAIEACCLSIEGITDALAFKYETPSGAQLALKYVSSDKYNVTVEQIRDFLIKNLPAYMIPNDIKKIDALVYSANGKKIRNTYTPQSQNTKQADSEPESSTEDLVVEAIMKIITKVTGQIFDKNDDSLELLDSLQYISLLVELENLFGVEFEDRQLNLGAFLSLDELSGYVVKQNLTR
ncbi:MAG: AMP-binding protein [Oscillospiraceae bacterium]|nr:AMP-binding protein [Oscillospiraceae bacterium]